MIKQKIKIDHFQFNNLKPISIKINLSLYMRERERERFLLILNNKKKYIIQYNN
jgi:hypothetical protein